MLGAIQMIVSVCIYLSQVDWKLINSVLDLFVSLGAIVAAALAVYGINAWRREHIGKRRIDLAEDVLALFYEAADVIGHMRSPLKWADEGKTRVPDENETPEEKAILDEAFIVMEHLNSRSDLFSKIHVLRYRFKAQNGEDAIKPFEDLAKVRRDIRGAARSCARIRIELHRPGLTDEDRVNLKNRLHKHEDTLHGTLDGADSTDEKMDRIIKNIQATCRKIIDS